jgi:hypothetical protein
MRKVHRLGAAFALLLLGACGSGTEEVDPGIGSDTQALAGLRLAADYWSASYGMPARLHPAVREERCTVGVLPYPYQLLLGGVAVSADGHVRPLFGRHTRGCALDERPVLLPLVTMAADGRRLPLTLQPTLAEKAAQVSAFVSGLVAFDLRLDGRPLAPVQVQRTGPQPFAYRLPPLLPLPYTTSRVASRPVSGAVADGVFAFLPTLPHGDHLLEVEVHMADPRHDVTVLYAVHR